MFFVFVIVAVLVFYLSFKYLFLSSARIGALSGRYVLITGCDSGFGNILACKLDKIGVHVFAGCLTQQGIDSLRENCSQNLIPVQLDVTNEEMIADVVRFVKSKLPEGKALWGLVNNAGIDICSPFEWASISDMRRVEEVNVWGMVNTTKALLPLIKTAKGRIVNVTSLASRLPYVGHSAYTLSKYAARAFSECLRAEMRFFDVGVHSIEPGFYKSFLSDGENLCKDLRRVWGTLDEDIKKEYGHSYIQRICDETVKLASTGSTKTYEVADAIEHALFAVHPKERYPVGYANIFYLLLWLPTWVAIQMQEQFPPPCPN